MHIFTVSLFGHRTIEDPWQLEERLTAILKELLMTKPYVSFLIGRNGEFDEQAASIIKRLQKDVGKEKCDITLVLPYTVAKLEYYEKYYDAILIPACMHGAHPKSAITLKNKWMVENADLVIVFAKHKGGAFTAMQYAEKQNKLIVRI